MINTFLLTTTDQELEKRSQESLTKQNSPLVYFDSLLSPQNDLQFKKKKKILKISIETNIISWLARPENCLSIKRFTAY